MRIAAGAFLLVLGMYITFLNDFEARRLAKKYPGKSFTCIPFLGGCGMFLGVGLVDEFKWRYIGFLFIDYGCFPVFLVGIANAIYLGIRNRRG
jgi:hypothetical protein